MDVRCVRVEVDSSMKIEGVGGGCPAWFWQPYASCRDVMWAVSHALGTDEDTFFWET